MFTLRIHTIDTTQPPLTNGGGGGGGTSAITGAKSKKNNPFTSNSIEFHGVVHLFRNTPLKSLSSTNPPIMTLWNVATRTTIVFIVAVPNYLSPQEFIAFCGNHVHEFQHISFIRNDAVEDQYSVLIKLVNQAAADGFFSVYNGKRFIPSQTEICHIYFAQQVEYTDSLVKASEPPQEYTELPTCPICLERLDYDTSAIQITHCDDSFRCPCISNSTNLSCQVCRLLQRPDKDVKPSCEVCGTSRNPWVCLICGFVGCGRYEKAHAVEHYKQFEHCYSLELESRQIWDYFGDKYVHRLNQSKVGSKSIMTNYHSSEGLFGNKEDAEVGGVLFSSKVDTIVDEYNFLLATQMETQRQHYETLLTEVKSGKEISIAEAIVKAEVETTQELQHKLEELSNDTKYISHINEDLAKDQESLKKMYKQIQEREITSLKMKDEKILDLEEQIRDLKIFMEAQKTLHAASGDIKGGTLLPVQSNPSTNSKKNSKRRSRKHN